MYHCIQTLYKITSERGQPLYKEQNAWSQSVLYLEVHYHACITSILLNTSPFHVIKASLSEPYLRVKFLFVHTFNS